MTNEQKRYTAQEMREAAQHLVDNLWAKDSTIVAMLRQAADTEEENAKLRETINSDSASMAGKDAVIAQLKARLEAVVKECEKINEEKFRMNEVIAAKGIPNRILRAARGEGGAK